MLTALYSLTLFLGAALMFWSEPMIGRMLLPSLGGSPAVWNTCMVFFQLALLGGYALAHGMASRCPAFVQKAGLAVLLGAGFVVLPIGLDPARLASLPGESSPVPWLLVTLVLMAGLPFLALSTLAPTLQRWWSQAGSGRGKDPYFLYAASNAGSLLALIGYPTLIEPRLGLAQQAQVWQWGYGALTLLTITCLLVTRWRATTTTSPLANVDGGHRPVYWGDRLAWLCLAAVPSSLLLGTTNFLTTDIASFPLLWVVPLALYLLTFIVAFSTRTMALGKWAARLLPFGVLALGFAIIMRATAPVWLVLPMHLLVFFLAALACHARLFAARPETRHLTEFYLWLAAGGALGGSFNALLAPLLFNHVHEYPLMLVTATALVGLPIRAPQKSPLRLSAAAAFVGAAVVLTLIAPVLLRAGGVAGNRMAIGAAFALPVFLAAALLRQPKLSAIVLGAAMFTATLTGTDPLQARQHAERSFFGVTQVTRDVEGRFHELLHGHTVHGREFLDPQRRCEPLTYYHPSGPFGDVHAALTNRANLRVAVIGLGSGAMATYARAGDRWTFFEIDPAAINVARNPKLFRYLSDCCAGAWDIVAGDARLRLQAQPDGEFDLIALDAFSSDAIPVHLLTREALRLYRQKLKPGGMIAMHISNRYLNLEGVVAALAADAHWQMRTWADPDDDVENGKSASEWTVIVESEAALGSLRRRVRWFLPAPAKAPPWTDDFSSLLSAFAWE